MHLVMYSCLPSFKTEIRSIIQKAALNLQNVIHFCFESFVFNQFNSNPGYTAFDSLEINIVTGIRLIYIFSCTKFAKGSQFNDVLLYVKDIVFHLFCDVPSVNITLVRLHSIIVNDG